jgi:hypothetical protein
MHEDVKTFDPQLDIRLGGTGIGADKGQCRRQVVERDAFVTECTGQVQVPSASQRSENRRAIVGAWLVRAGAETPPQAWRQDCKIRPSQLASKLVWGNLCKDIQHDQCCP